MGSSIDGGESVLLVMLWLSVGIEVVLVFSSLTGSFLKFFNLNAVLLEPQAVGGVVES